MSTNPTSSSGGNRVLDYLNGLDLSKYPELALKFAAVNQQGMTGITNELIEAIQRNQASTLTSVINSGYSSATTSLVAGGFEGALGLVQAGSSAYQVKASADNISELNGLMKQRNVDLEDVRAAKGADENVIEPVKTPQKNGVPLAPGSSTEMSDMTGRGRNIGAQAQPGQAPSENTRPVDQDALKLKKADAERTYKNGMEQAKARNTRATNVAQGVQGAFQLLKVGEQGAQGIGQQYQMKQSVYNNAYSAENTAAQDANQTLRKNLEFDANAVLIASSRA